MAKLHKMEYYNKTENQMKVFSYTIPVPKAMVEQAGLENVDVELKLDGDKIIIQKKVDKY